MYIFELNSLFILGLPIWIIARIIMLVNRRKKGIEFNIGNEIITNLFVIYLFLLIGITIFPIAIGGRFTYLQDLSVMQRYRINIIPFESYFKTSLADYSNHIFSIKMVMRNLIGNLILLTPFILYICIRNEKCRSLKSSAKIAFLISLSIEMMQLFMNIFGIADGRTIDIDDLILNTLGGIIAWGIFKFIYKGKIKNIIDNIYPQLIESNEIAQS